MFARFRRRFAALGAVLVAAVLLTGCLTVHVPAGSTYSDRTGFTYPTGQTYDWLWLSFTEELADNAIPTFGATVIEAQVCFPQSPAFPGYARPYAEPGPYVPDQLIYPGTSAAGCSGWIPLARAEALPQGGVNIHSMGWRKMTAMFPGERFTVQVRMNQNWAAQDQDVWPDAWVATGDLTTVWYQF